MTDKNLPSPELLRKLLRYEPDTGKLYWRERTPDMFVDSERSAEWACKSWNTRYAGKEALTADNGHGYKHGDINGKRLLAHRVIWSITRGEWPLDQIDHINGIRHDNRLSNLRSVSRAENMKNMKKPSNNISGVVGVSWFKARKKWVAQIQLDGKNKNLGRFEKIEDAIAARKAAEAKYGFHANHGRQT